MRPGFDCIGMGADANPPEVAIYEGWAIGVKRGTRFGWRWGVDAELFQLSDFASVRVWRVWRHRLVMPGLVPGIHALFFDGFKDVDGRAFAAPKGLRPRRRDEPGHDDVEGHLIRPGWAVLS